MYAILKENTLSDTVAKGVLYYKLTTRKFLVYFFIRYIRDFFMIQFPIYFN